MAYSPEPEHVPESERPPYRPPIGVPMERQARWAFPVSLAVHVVLVLILVLVSIVTSRSVIEAMRGAGGAGPEGGGGGGGGAQVQERVQYIRVAPPASTSPKKAAVVPPKTVVPPPPKVVKPKPAPRVEKPAVQPPPPVSAPIDVHVKAPDPPTNLAMAAGAGDSAGAGNTSGRGPGTGGGVGTGTGPGRGSATGPGTGGGTGTIYPATPDFLLLPPDPPDKLKGRSVIVTFIIDAHGRPERVEFESTGDRAYDKLLREKFSAFHFRPAHTMDGTAVPSRLVIPLRL